MIMSLASWSWVRGLDAPGAIQLSSFASSARKTNRNEALSYADEKTHLIARPDTTDFSLEHGTNSRRVFE